MSRILRYLSDKWRALRSNLTARWDGLMSVAALAFAHCLVMPATPSSRVDPRPIERWVLWMEDQGRYVNTIAQIAVPLITRDVIGLKALIWVGLAGTTATHGLKRTLDDVEVRGVRLGQRPHSGDSRHNFPSGHAALASSGAVFMASRYSWYWLLLLLPITLGTMYARVALDEHTWSAVIAGASLGVLFTRPFCRRRSPDQTG
ncbi:MAG: phosphatase PAP2 family protein [Betaproteobacteria bacterium]